MANLFLRTTNIFLWKHWKCFAFSWIWKLLLIVIPILLTWGQIYAFHNSAEGQQVIFDPMDESRILEYFPGNDHDLIFYTPKTYFYEELMENVRMRLQIYEERIRAFDNEKELDEYFRMHKKNHDFAIIFHDINESGNHGEPKLLNYTIQTRSNKFETEKIFVDDIYTANLKEIDEYMFSGFIALQYSLNKAFIEITSSKSDQAILFELEKFPGNARDSLFFLGLTPTAVILFFVYIPTLMSMVLVPMVEEKEDGVKEYLRIASAYSYLNNATFFFINVFIGCLIFGVSLLLANCYGLLGHIPSIWLIILIGLYVVSSVAYTYLMSVIFDSVFFAKSAGFLCYLAPFLVIQYNMDKLRYIVPIFNSALFYNGVGIFDSIGRKGLVFSSEFLFDSTDGMYSMFDTYLFLAMDIVLYTFLYYYLSSVFPGKCGTPRPFYFPLMIFFNNRNSISNSMPDEEAGEPLSNGEVAVEIRNLTKVYRQCFGKNVEAVKNLSMNIYKNQITVLLGHNGAGKTTTMSMITGIIPKTSGSIRVDGKTNINEYRHRIGYCPQHDVFLRYFTCVDHLVFFGCLRGLTSTEAMSESRFLLDQLRLREKAKEYGKNLSGGMKRRLCLGNALIGKTQIAILDEPSSGLDPESRRELWDVLLEMRKDHTILLTTHYMEEAEILADKIAIISNGEGLCFNTSLKLKQQYAEGYILKLLTCDERFDKLKTMAKIRDFVPSARIIEPFVKPTLNISLPYKYMNKFPVMLETIETNMLNLGIKSISITNSSLEDVFLSFGKDYNKSIDEVDAGYQPFVLPDTFKSTVMSRIQLQQIGAIFYKKAIYMRQKWIYWLLLFLFPISAIILSFVMINATFVDHSHWQTLNLNFGNYPEPEILVHFDRSLGSLDRYNETIRKVIEENHANIRFMSNSYETIEEEALSIERDNTTHYHEHVPAALYFYQEGGEMHVKMLFAGNVLHSSATVMNLASNIVLKMVSGNQYGIETRNQPLKKEKTAVSGTDMDIYIAFLPIAMFFYILFYVFLPFNEERTEFKKLQSISPFIYWGSYFLFDLLIHTVYCGIIYAVHVACDKNHYFDNTEYILFATIFLFYGLAYIPMMYIFCQIFSTMSSLYSFMLYLFVAMNIFATFMSANQDNMRSYGNFIMVLLIFPDYALRHAISALFITYQEVQHSKTAPNFNHRNTDILYLPESPSYIGSSGELDLARYYIYMAVSAVVSLILLMGICENIYRRDKLENLLKSLRKLCCCRRGATPCILRQTSVENNDEKDLIDSIIRNESQDGYAIIVANLEKKYDEVNAVNGINFAVNKGECFGLLGMNGAGKTTTFKMMTHQTPATKGEIYYGGRSCTKEPVHYKMVFGYCPQVDALNGYMTAYETLKYMGLCRGIPCNEIDKQVDRWLHQTDLVSYANVCVSNYSGGTKRKLNTALAMIADPSLVFLDEPTTGVDPISRRFVWSSIQNCQKQNKNIVLTSHSMDECESLCNRLAIMANGQVKCIGPVQELKNSFGLGFVIVIMLHKGTSSSPIDQSMRSNFQQCQLVETYAGKLRYVVLDKNLQWSQVFHRILTMKQNYENDIDEVSVCETSLEDIFMKIARDTTRDSQALETSEV